MPCAWLQGQPADKWLLKFRPMLHPKQSQDGVELAWRLVTIQFILEFWKGYYPNCCGITRQIQ